MKKYDFIIIAAVLAISGALFFFLYGAPSHSGKYVEIEINGSVSQVLALDEDRVLEIETEGGKNTLEIKDGYAKITEADCPDKICQKHQKICRSGESIICLPHKLVISITDKSGDDEIDIKV